MLSPDPATDSNIHFGKYQIHVGGNRGRGQVYPTGEKSNNTVYTAPASGTIASIEPGDNGASVVSIKAADGSSVSETIPVGPEVLVSVGDSIEAGAALTNDPNVGGFGQGGRRDCSAEPRSDLRPARLLRGGGSGSDHAGAEEKADRKGSGR